VKLLPILFKAIGSPRDPALAGAVTTLRAWYAAGGHRRDMTKSGHDEFTPAIELMDAWWPKLLTAEFEPMLGKPAFDRVHGMTGFGGSDFDDGWFSYPYKDLRRLFAKGRERGPYSRVYCGNLPGKRYSSATLRSRCRTVLQQSLAEALTVTPAQLYGRSCPSDPEPACADKDTFTYASAITIPAFPYQNRPTFQQVVTLTRQLPR
jgi:hypothetical protein